MFFSLVTVVCYAASSLGDKYIAAKLKCTTAEFSFLVGLATACFLACLLPVFGWHFAPTWGSFSALAVITVLKIVEFYTSALLLKRVSAYELKAWLSLNVALSYFIDLALGRAGLVFAALPCAGMIVFGVASIARSERTKRGDAAALCLFYITSKFLYGLQMSALPAGTSSVCVLALSMLAVALLALPFVRVGQLVRRKGVAFGIATRAANAAGLLAEAFAAQQNLLLYALIQPMQLALLFAAALVRKEKLGAQKIAGSIITLAAVCLLTVLLYLKGGWI